MITVRKLPVGRDSNPKISFSLNFTSADGRKPVIFEIPEATLDHVFGLEAIPLPTCSSEIEGRYKRWRPRSIFAVGGLLSTLKISTPPSPLYRIWLASDRAPMPAPLARTTSELYAGRRSPSALSG